MIANGWLKETSTNIKVAAKNSSDCKNTTLRAQQPKSTYLKTCNNYHTKTLQGRLRLPCPAQFKNRKTVSHNAVRRKNRLTEKTHASGKTKKCLSWHPSQWRMGRFGGTVESFLTASGGFLSLGRLEEVNSVIRWGPWRTCYIRASKLLTKLLPLGLLLIIHPHPDCKTMTKPNEDGRTVQHLCKRCTDVTHGMGADLSPSVHRSLVSPVQSDTQ